MSEPVKQIDPDLYAKMMSLPVGIRIDLLEFLGATPVAEVSQVGILEEFYAPVDPAQNRIQGNRMSFTPELSGKENPRPKPPSVALT